MLIELPGTLSNVTTQRVREETSVAFYIILHVLTLYRTLTRISHFPRVSISFNPFPDAVTLFVVSPGLLATPDVPAYATSDQVATYIESYADHFKLRSHFRLGMAIEHIDRSDKDDQWKVRFIDRDSKCCIELFDRVVVTTGAYAIPHTIKLDGSEHFSGMLIHAQAFKEYVASAPMRPAARVHTAATKSNPQTTNLRPIAPESMETSKSLY